jgi:uncharacterized protein YdhG (YjbR/CyaY superfamily)
VSVIDDHFARFDDVQRPALLATATTIRTALPGATEVISYGMPTFKIGGEKGVAVIGLDGFRHHNSLFPYSGLVLSEFADDLARYTGTKGSIHFERDRPFPAPLLKRILKTRIREINAGYPKPSGEAREFYDNGVVKASGKVKDGQLHGAWRWFRRDGTLLRSGAFRAGTQVGEWTTYDRAGDPHTVTRLG